MIVLIDRSIENHEMAFLIAVAHFQPGDGACVVAYVQECARILAIPEAKLPALLPVAARTLYNTS